MNRYWKKWKKLHNVQFEFDGNRIEGNLDVERGRGWDASIVGPTRVGAVPVLWLPECSGLVLHSVCSAVVQVSAKEVEYKTVYKRRALKEAVIEEVYPPSITVKDVHSEIQRHLRCPRLIHLHASGTKSGRLTFPVEVSEEKECEFVRLVCGIHGHMK